MFATPAEKVNQFMSTSSVMVTGPKMSDDNVLLTRMDPSDRVRKSVEYVTSVADHVKLDTDAIHRLAKKLWQEIVDGKVENWKNHELRPKALDQAAIDWIFLANALNFSFWSESQTAKFAIELHGKSYTGTMSVWAAINRALEEDLPIFDADYLAHIPMEEVQHIFKTSTTGEMPLLVERQHILHETGQILNEKFNGTFLNCVKAANGSSQRLLEIVLENFPSFRDSTVYRNRRVDFYKRAQVLIADIWSCFDGKGFGTFSDIDKLTIFADYRIPQMLNYFGTTIYSEELQKKLQANVMFNYGDAEEVEIRASTVHVAELLKKEINSLIQQSGKPGEELSPINGVFMDQYLWGFRQAHGSEMKHIPFHKIRSIYY